MIKVFFDAVLLKPVFQVIVNGRKRERFFGTAPSSLMACFDGRRIFLDTQREEGTAVFTCFVVT